MLWKIGSQEIPLQETSLWPIPTQVTQTSHMSWALCAVKDDSAATVYSVARALAKLIAEHYGVWLRRIMRQHYAYLAQRERQVMLVRVMAVLGREDADAKRKRLDRMTVAAVMFLGSHEEVNIEGFQDFLLQDICLNFMGFIDKAIDDYFAEQEYEQFVQFLKGYVQRRENHVECAHVIFGPEDMTILDGNGRNIGAPIIADLADGLDFSDDGQMRQEMIVSTLVLLGPQEIVLHNEIPPEMFQMLGSIFGGRVFFDSGDMAAPASSPAGRLLPGNCVMP
jgi:putative sporulation protein YtxC